LLSRIRKHASREFISMLFNPPATATIGGRSIIFRKYSEMD